MLITCIYLVMHYYYELSYWQTYINYSFLQICLLLKYMLCKELLKKSNLVKQVMFNTFNMIT